MRMMTNKLRLAFGMGSLIFAFAGCSHANTDFSPLVGTWRINGSVPAPSADVPQFTVLTFKSDGALDASYVVAKGAIGHIVQSSPQIKQERDTYTLAEPSTLHILEGSRSLDFTYEVHDDHLTLTPSSGGDAVVYVKSPSE